jgi:hypothetical protein
MCCKNDRSCLQTGSQPPVAHTWRSAQLAACCCLSSVPRPSSRSSSSRPRPLLNRAGCHVKGDVTGTPHAADCCSITEPSPTAPEGSSVHPSGCCGASEGAKEPQVCSRGSCCCSCSALLTARRLLASSRTCRGAQQTPFYVLQVMSRVTNTSHDSRAPTWTPLTEST